MSPGAEGVVPAPPHPDEATRLAALRDYAVLDSRAEPAFDDIAFLASYICGTPIALISLVDEHRQWFKARIGVEAEETSRDVAFCAHAILEPGEIFVVPDAFEDPRFSANPLVRADPGIRFYAGAPLNTLDGMPLGTLCVFDRVPRRLNAEQARALGALSREVVVHLELRRAIVALTAPDAVGTLDPGVGTEMRAGLEEASRAAASASTLVGEAMERVLDAEQRLRNLVYRMQALQRQPVPRLPA